MAQNQKQSGQRYEGRGERIKLAAMKLEEQKLRKEQKTCFKICNRCRNLNETKKKTTKLYVYSILVVKYVNYTSKNLQPKGGHNASGERRATVSNSSEVRIKEQSRSWGKVMQTQTPSPSSDI